MVMAKQTKKRPITLDDDTFKKGANYFYVVLLWKWIKSAN